MAYRALLLLDINMIVSRHWGVRVLPTTFVLDGLRHICYLAEGGRDSGEFQDTRPDKGADCGTGDLRRWLEPGASGCHCSYL